MKISELRARQGSVNIEAVVKEIEETKIFNKFGRDLKVANAMIEDESGSMKLTLWNDEIEKVHKGDKIRITNGFVNEFKGDNQLTAGKFGKIEVITHGKESHQSQEAPVAGATPAVEADEDDDDEDALDEKDSKGEEEYTEDY